MLSRAIILYLPTIAEDKRQDEETYWHTFEAAQPKILGALLDIVSAALQQRPQITLARLPRMADFALWSCAAAAMCGWTAEDFLKAYQGVREAAYELTLDASPVGPFVRDFAVQHSPWEGTASELLTAMETLAQERMKAPASPAGQAVTMQAPKMRSDVTKQKRWPKKRCRPE